MFLIGLILLVRYKQIAVNKLSSINATFGLKPASDILYCRMNLEQYLRLVYEEL